MSGESTDHTEGFGHDATQPARLDWVDALKGVGILLVVAGHVWTRGWVRDAIYAFHMPLFFILSGYTARAVPWRTFLPAALRGLWLPFLCFSAILLAADFLIEGAKGFRPIFPSLWDGAWTILFATEETRGPFTILWFIPALFFARLLWNALAARGWRATDWQVQVVMAAVFVLALVAHELGERSPFALLAVPGALLMIWAGALWRYWGAPSAGWGLALAALAIFILFYASPLNMKQGEIGVPELSLAGAAAATVTLAGLVQRLPLAAIAGFAMLGRASLVIMYVHVAIIHYLRPYAPAFMIFFLAIVLSWGLNKIIKSSKFTRRVLLGEPQTAR